MATKTLLSVEEYFRMSFEVAPDFVDGELVERNLGENEHSRVQVRLVGFFLEVAKEYPVHVRTELHMRVTPTRFRVADLAVFMGSEPEEKFPSSPPLLVVEIISREDRYTDIVAKLDEYRNWGVPHVWLLDPWLRRLHSYGQAGLKEVPLLEIPELSVQLSTAEVF